MGCCQSEPSAKASGEEVEEEVIFPGCWIPETEMRGITLLQLAEVLKKLKKSAEAWLASGGPKAGQAIPAEEINLYDTTQYIILPATAPFKCSYVELVAKSPQRRPIFFVSHWWGEAVSLFYRCLEQHGEDRMLAQDAPYWVCAYANNQHSLGAAVTNNPTESSFYKALCLVEGVISVVDAEGMVFTRVWCVFEVFHALMGNLKSDFKWDVYTAHDHHYCGDTRHAVGIVDGLAYHNINNQKSGNKEYPGFKIMRESHFPVNLLSKSVTLCLEAGQATVEADRKHILNSMVGRKDSQLDEEPLRTHSNYQKANDVVRGRLANATFDVGLQQDDDVFKSYLNALSRSGVKNLFVRIPENVAKERHDQFVDALPTSLETVVIGGLVSVPESLGKLTSLKSLNLSGLRATNLPESVGNMLELEVIILNHCESLISLPNAMLKLAKLKHLELKDCKSLKDIPDFSKELRVQRT
mmetsp:Transcript_89956/g.160104  ORF Transcript_89956/g.160104 Transcript_89956/m.160104 type:complete len:469 (+) Transcript_89956:125-1531(+)|eukprot:CAMPEP_0197630580 /NCGR_PEP_ID=MMETSP1338-20131121/8012_1 /TAXON_ID=43686 ORGANISM="Pelagodinium beii, Strain RCC1491" /NCGR_SAMPLE_ID=MMETSP1338 /ASSEMBLY_ACC=CAM_ASM_000754 /LENGTH=468 /DNA_ID=CAMNT_0043201821 /DNA_START=100 /DNA_END=1506 /DNA_ORIENTATION=-